MEEVRSLVARFPQREFDIRRRCFRDAEFRSICRDYEDATAALCHWRQAAADYGKVEEYTNILNELEVEILAYLGREASRTDGH